MPFFVHRKLYHCIIYVKVVNINMYIHIQPCSYGIIFTFIQLIFQIVYHFAK